MTATVNDELDEQLNFQTAKLRIELRQRRRNQLYIWLGVFGILLTLTIFGGHCLTPITFGVGLFTLLRGVQFYNTSPYRVLPEALIAQEMGWLYGEDWRGITGQSEYDFAKERIRKRRYGRVLFLAHLLLFIPVDGIIFYMAYTFTKYREPAGSAIYVVATIWVIALITHLVFAFPTAGMLSRREHAAASALEYELESLNPEKQKRGEKLKRGSRVVLGDDGELIEVPDDIEAKPKRQMDSQ